MKRFSLPARTAFARTLSLPILSAMVVATSLSLSAASAADPAKAAATAEKSAKLPIEQTFAKETAGENKGLSSLTLKNTSSHALKVSGVIEYSVVVHNRDKSKVLPAQEIAPGKTWKIDGLAAHDKITLTAEGFAPLVLTAP